MEQQNLQANVGTATHLLLQKLSELERARDELAIFAARNDPLPGDIPTQARLHELLSLYHVERVEVFRGLHREIEAYRWERGSGRWLETPWLPPNPSIAAKVAGGRSATWVQRTPGGLAALKLCGSLPAAPGSEHRWLVVSEPLDGT